MIPADRPYAAYVRVSTGAAEREQEDRLRSPTWQMEAVRRYAQGEGLDLREYPHELDVSGAKNSRPVLDQIIADVNAGELGGIIVAKLDRLSRMKPRDRVLMFEEVEAAGGRVLSASETLDVSTPEGRFAREVFLGVARMQWEKYAETFDRAKRGAIARGAKAAGTPFGYIRGAGSRLEPCPVEGPIVQEAFRLASLGDIVPVVAYLREAAPVRLRNSNRQNGRRRAGDPRNWTHRAVRLVLANRSYLGEVRQEGIAPCLDAHPPLVTRAEFEAARPLAIGGELVKRRAPKMNYPLSGVVVCNECGLPCIGSISGTAPKGRRVYRCGTDGSRRDGRGNRLTCSKRAYVNADRLEAYLSEWLRREYPRRMFAEPTEAGQEGLLAAERELAEAERELDDFLGDTEGAGTLRRVGRYQAALDARVGAVEAAQVKLGELAQNAQSRKQGAPDWDALTPGELAGLLGGLGAEVVIRQAGRGVRDIEPRVAVIIDDDEPAAVASA